MKLLILNLGLGLARSPRQQCVERQSHHGEYNLCPERELDSGHYYSYIVGLCASGGKEDCKTDDGWMSHEIKCCNQLEIREPSLSRCQNFYGNYG